MDVSIIFVNYKTKELTTNAIRSVIEKTESIQYEIFVVDNNSQDGSIEAIEKEFPQINIIKNPVNAGFGAANNLAMKQATGKYIFCLNTDTLLINNAIKIMFDFMEKDENENVGACGGFLVDRNNKPAICGGHFPSITSILWKFGIRNLFPKGYKKYCVILNSDDEEFLYDIDYISGADIFLRKSVLDIVGCFDEQYFMFYEETDLCTRIKKAGYKIKFISEAKIQHLENQSIKNNIKHIKMLKNSELLYFQKHYSKQVWLVKLMYIILYSFSVLFIKNETSIEGLKIMFKGIEVK